MALLHPSGFAAYENISYIKFSNDEKTSLIDISLTRALSAVICMDFVV